MNILENLLQEQTKVGNIANTRPYLVQLSKTVASRVFRDMVAIQETNNPTAQVFGLKFLTEDGKTLHNRENSVTGATANVNTKQIPELTKGLSVRENELYKIEDVIYIANRSGPLQNEPDFVLKAILDGTIRLYSDAAETSYFESNEPAEAKFEIGKWVVPCKTRKVSVNISQELVQDLESNGLDSIGIIENTLSSAIVNEVNKDIISKLITVSKRYDEPKLGIKDGFVDFSQNKNPLWQQGRDISAMIGAAAADILSNTTYSATYVIVSPNVYGLLCGAGLVVINEESQMTRSHGYLKSGLKVYVDTYSSFDYFVVGCKHNITIAEYGHPEPEPIHSDENGQPTELLTEDQEYIADDLIGQLYYIPYLEEDGTSVYIIRDPKSFSNNVMLMTRYGLCVNPFTIDGLKVNQGDDWKNLVGKSNLSNIVGLKLK